MKPKIIFFTNILLSFKPDSLFFAIAFCFSDPKQKVKKPSFLNYPSPALKCSQLMFRRISLDLTVKCKQYLPLRKSCPKIFKPHFLFENYFFSLSCLGFTDITLVDIGYQLNVKEWFPFSRDSSIDLWGLASIYTVIYLQLNPQSLG